MLHMSGWKISIADSRFQDALLHEAKDAGKIARSYEIPAHHRDNCPERLERTLAPAREAGVLKTFPFGTDFTDTEQMLMPALERIRAVSGSKRRMAALALGGLTGTPAANETACLERMGLARTISLKERFFSLLIKAALRSRNTTV